MSKRFARRGYADPEADAMAAAESPLTGDTRHPGKRTPAKPAPAPRPAPPAPTAVRDAFVRAALPSPDPARPGADTPLSAPSPVVVFARPPAVSEATRRAVAREAERRAEQRRAEHAARARRGRELYAVPPDGASQAVAPGQTQRDCPVRMAHDARVIYATPPDGAA